VQVEYPVAWQRLPLMLFVRFLVLLLPLLLLLLLPAGVAG
jgi:hypothetical protein